MQNPNRQIAAVGDLLVDSRKGYHVVSQRANDRRLTTLLEEIVDRRSDMLMELNKELAANGLRELSPNGTLLGWLHRTWINVRHFISFTLDVNLLVEVTHGEGYLIRAYDDALAAPAVGRLRALLEQQRTRLLNNLDRLQNLELAMSEA